MIKTILQVHYEEWKQYCSKIHNHVLKKHSAPARETILKLVSKYYNISDSFPAQKMKWNIEKYQYWDENDWKKWLATAKIILHKNRLLRQLSRRISIKIPNKVMSNAQNKYNSMPHTIVKIITKNNSETKRNENTFLSPFGK